MRNISINDDYVSIFIDKDYSVRNKKFKFNSNDNYFKFKYIDTIKPKYKEDCIYKDNITYYDTFLDGIKRHSNKELVKSLSNFTLGELKNKKHFVEFRLDTDIESSGVYLWVVDNNIKYVGITGNLKTRFYEYGHIVSDNIFKGGRSTNCKMNMYVSNNINSQIKIYFYDTSEYDNNIKKISKTERRNIEKYLINYLIDSGCNLLNTYKW